MLQECHFTHLRRKANSNKEHNLAQVDERIHLRYFVLQGIFILEIFVCVYSRDDDLYEKNKKGIKHAVPEEFRNVRDKAKGVQYIEEQQ